MSSTPSITFLTGPTGSGKSRLALEWAEKMDAEIVSADAYQVYRGLEVLTAAPSEEDLARIPHHLISILDPCEAWDAAQHARRAQACIQDILARGRKALVVGGSGLYLKFISHGISPAPPSDPQLRLKLEQQPLSELVAQFQAIDPEGAAQTNLSNLRYVVRNLEIVLLGKKPLSEWKKNWQNEACGSGYTIVMPTEELDARIYKRAGSMLSQGAIEEVAALEECSPTAENTLGLRQIRQLLAGELDLPSCQAAIALATRQYAKRQRTWLRREKWLQEIPRA